MMEEWSGWSFCGFKRRWTVIAQGFKGGVFNARGKASLGTLLIRDIVVAIASMEMS